MIVFADQHHFGLYSSLKLLFENRLGGTLYRPVGREWLDQGYWRMAEIYNNHPTTVAQYLGAHDDWIAEGGIYKIWEAGHQFYQHAITLEQFFNEPIDIVIASIPEHIESFKRLCDKHPHHPKMIYQIGNSWPIEAGMASNIMASAIIHNIPAGVNIIQYHQEFNTKIFSPHPTSQTQNIYSFINCLNTASIYADDWLLFTALEANMPDWIWRTFGGSCRDGECNGQQAVADKISQARFIWHVKNGGDGYGHVIHNAYAMGIPPIVKMAYYDGKMAGQLMRDGETCIAIDGLTVPAIIDKINHYNEPNIYQRMRQNVYNVFKVNVDFDLEQTQIEAFLSKCK